MAREPESRGSGKIQDVDPPPPQKQTGREDANLIATIIYCLGSSMSRLRLDT